MSSLCMFDGFIVGKKELRTSVSGKEMLAFGLSVLINPKAEDFHDRNKIFNFVAWDKTAQYIENNVKSGANYMYIQSIPRVREYQDASGEKKTTLDFNVTHAACHTLQTKSAVQNIENNGRTSEHDDYDFL